MRYYYAQINPDDGRCVGVLDTHMPIVAAHMIPITQPDSSYMGRRYIGGAWLD